VTVPPGLARIYVEEEEKRRLGLLPAKPSGTIRGSASPW
jgi:hypothetical protein